MAAAHQQADGPGMPSSGIAAGSSSSDSCQLADSAIIGVLSREQMLQMRHITPPGLSHAGPENVRSMSAASNPRSSPPASPYEAHQLDDNPRVEVPKLDDDSATSVVLINIPVNYTREMVISLFDKEGFGGSYDFLYLPVDPSSSENLGYLVVNFVASEQCSKFVSRYHGALAQSCFSFMRTGQLCEVRPSAVQGKQANYDRVRLHSCFGLAAAARTAGCENVAERHLAAEAAAFAAARTRAAALKKNSCEDRETVVRKQIEFYFSSSNLGQDDYLRSLMDAAGWIELGQLIKFPRLKSHGVSVQMAAASLSGSTCVEVSSDGRRVRHSNAILREVFHAAPKERPPADAPKHGMSASGLSTDFMESKVRQIGKDDVYF